MNAQSLVAKVWNFAHVLRDQGVSYHPLVARADQTVAPVRASLRDALEH